MDTVYCKKINVNLRDRNTDPALTFENLSCQGLQWCYGRGWWSAGVRWRCRLFGIDTPETSQSYGKAAKNFTSAMLAGREVRVETIATDHYGRTVGVVFVDNINLNEQIVAQGFGWMYRQYCKESFCYDWLKLEEASKTARKGLWAEANPVPPWEYRQEQRTGKSSNSSHVALHQAIHRLYQLDRVNITATSTAASFTLLAVRTTTVRTVQ
jgi:endonuclease YncB( thermonuclease family)